MKPKTKINFPSDLPITRKKNDIISAIKNNQVVIISGETGCGKSTQIPKMCLEAGLGREGQIACTQPRRIAATTIAKRIAEELGENLGQTVGYKIRFQDKAPKHVSIKIMTDGMLLAETQYDSRLVNYSTLIVDEAHERSLNIDFLLGIAKTILPFRPKLKLIITSATLDTEKFSRAFNNAPVIHIGGKLFPIQLEYFQSKKKPSLQMETDYLNETVKAVQYLRSKHPPGDILIFMPTEQDILETSQKLKGQKYPGVSILPLFARLPGSQQGRVYSVKGQKIVVATNVAETSLTIPGIRYVIDTGLARISSYIAGTHTNSLPISPISKSSAQQRKGRCGRVQKGLCLRLYSQEDYNSRPLFTHPEILRSNLAEVILRMIALNLDHPSRFPFVDKPHFSHIKEGYNSLFELDAIEKKGKEIVLTYKGKLMAGMPLAPHISRMLIEAEKEHCLNEMSIIASALSIRDPRERPLDKENQADQIHSPFKDPDSDFISLLNIWNTYHSKWEKLLSQSAKRKFCKKHFLSYPRMQEWTYIHNQILEILDSLNLLHKQESETVSPKELYARIHRSILSGYLSNIALNKEKNIYSAAKDREVMIFPGSALFNRKHSWIVASEFVMTSRLFARTTAKINVNWLEKLGGDRCLYSYSNARWDKKRGEVIADEKVSLYGLEIVKGRPVSYKRIDSEKAHLLFIRSALLEGQTRYQIPFITRNRNLTKRLSAIEDKLRRKDILTGERALIKFYSSRLPNVSDIRTLEHLIKKKGGDRFLLLSEKDVLKSFPKKEELLQYPDELDLGTLQVETAYTFSPGSKKDGVTLKIPARKIDQIPQDLLDWGVPGFFRYKVEALVKGLPKRFRKLLVPASDSINTIVNEIERSDRFLPNALSDFVWKRFRVRIPAKDWAAVQLPDYLQVRFALIDDKGNEIHAGRDLETLVKKSGQPLINKQSLEWTKAQKKWERFSLKNWDIDIIPECIPIGTLSNAYPALKPENNEVGIALFSRKEDAFYSHITGVEVLLLRKFKNDLDYAGKYLSLPEEYNPVFLYFNGKNGLEKSLFYALKKEVFQKNLRTFKEYNSTCNTIIRSLFEKGHILRERTLKILELYHQIRMVIQEAGKGLSSSKIFQSFCNEIRKELDILIPKNFPEYYSFDRLEQLPRYIAAIKIRINRAKTNLEKDQLKSDRIKKYQDILTTFNQSVTTETSMEKKKNIKDFYWMIEEFKVSLFAPELKTSIPISSKRLIQKQNEINKMI